MSNSSESQETFSCMFIMSYSVLECIYHVGDLYISHFVLESAFEFRTPSLDQRLNQLKRYKFDCLEKKFYKLCRKERSYR